MVIALFCLVFAIWQKLIGRSVLHASVRAGLLFVLLEILSIKFRF